LQLAGSRPVALPPQQDRRYQTARIQLMYGATTVPLMAEFTYVGMDRAQWLDQVKAGLPVKTVLPG